MITVKASIPYPGHGPMYEDRFKILRMRDKSYEVLLPTDYIPHARASYVRQWYSKGEVCTTVDGPKQLWSSVESQ